MGTGRLADQVGVVTGGASGIGEAVVRRLQAEGALVAVGDVDMDGLARLEDEFGDRLIGIRCDVTNEVEVQQLVETAVSGFGRLDCAFNVAGAGGTAPIRALDGAVWRRTIDIYLTGVFFSIKHASEAMIASGTGGAIVSVASICAQLPLSGAAPYCCAKAGVEMLTRVAALELGAHGIRVNSVSPGRIETPVTMEIDAVPTVREAWLDQTPLARIGQPEDVAGAMLFLAGEEAGYISGTNLVVDGAFSTTHFESVMRQMRAVT